MRKGGFVVRFQGFPPGSARYVALRDFVVVVVVVVDGKKKGKTENEAK